MADFRGRGDGPTSATHDFAGVGKERDGGEVGQVGGFIFSDCAPILEVTSNQGSAEAERHLVYEAHNHVLDDLLQAQTQLVDFGLRVIDVPG